MILVDRWNDECTTMERVYHLQSHDCLQDDEADALGGCLLDDDSYTCLVDDENATVLKPDGSPLLIYRARVLPKTVCKAAWEALRAAATPTDNRGMAAGALSEEQAKDRDALAETTTVGGRTVAQATRLYFRPVKRDGTLSRTNYAKPVNSGIVGYFDRYVRIPYCRATAYNLAHPDRFAAAMPFLHRVAEVFKTEAPERFAKQQAMIERTHPDFTIHGTPWTTITVNKNWRTAVHKDAGDYPEGFGVMAVMQGGRYEGGNLVFPKYRVAVNMRTQGVCLADVHEWHGNTPIRGIRGLYERVSVVLYYRASMWKCGSATEELERAKRRREGDSLYDPTLTAAND